MMRFEIKFKKTHPNGFVPTYGTKYSAGADMRSVEDVEIQPGETKLVDLGIAVAIPEECAGYLFPRSGKSVKTKLRMANSVGVIDSDYRGTVKAAFTNIGDSVEKIEAGEKCCQLVVMPYLPCYWTEQEELGNTDRGEGGFGSTGSK